VLNEVAYVRKFSLNELYLRKSKKAPISTQNKKCHPIKQQQACGHSAHACNPSYLEVDLGEFQLKASQSKKLARPQLNQQARRGGLYL
jgi:hypothetical protein